MRLFFTWTVTVPVPESESTVTYRAGYFHQVDDEQQAQRYIDEGVAETEEAHDKRIAAEAEAAAAPKIETPAGEQ